MDHMTYYTFNNINNEVNIMSETTMIYGYITDELFWKKKTVDLNKSVNTGIGYLDDILINYFNKIGTVYDSREERLDIIGEIPKGKISIYFDVSKMDPTNGPFINVQDEDIINLFNITEKCYITQNRSETEINDELIKESQIEVLDLRIPEILDLRTKKNKFIILINNIIYEKICMLLNYIIISL